MPLCRKLFKAGDEVQAEAENASLADILDRWLVMSTELCCMVEFLDILVIPRTPMASFDCCMKVLPCLLLSNKLVVFLRLARNASWKFNLSSYINVFPSF
mmetsp:Transcript_102595/g.295446  ORF Transcript_102595/g.295446 Transcript_102595/m.295446 type:complete len:100 (+) Transcript_102595:492-791(+)